MIDIHSHILFGVDDGAKNIEQSLNMIKAARDVGYTKICLTPHYMEDGYQTSRAELEQKLDLLESYIYQEDIPVELYLGEEVYIFPAMVQKMDEIISMNHSRYVLFELPLLEEVNYVDEVVYELLASDKIPILAHPERYRITNHNFDYIESLIQKGVLLQVNLNSIAGCYGREAKKNAIRLLKNHMASFLATDAHSSMGYYKINESIKMINSFVDAKYFYQLTQENPKKVIYNEAIEATEMKGTKKKRILFSIR